MCFSVQIVVQIGGKLLSHLQKTFSFRFFPYSTVQNERLSKYLERGEEQRQPQKGFIAWWGGCSSPWWEACALVPCASWAQQTILLTFSESLPGFDQYFHLAAEKKFPVENVVETALFS